MKEYFQRTPANIIKASKFMSWALRHEPEKAGIKLDPFGWVAQNDLRDAIGKHLDVYFQIEDLFHIINTSDKKRFEFSDDLCSVRAAQGHTIEVDLQLAELVPGRSYLYHGTSLKNIPSILETGINKGERHHVHLSEDCGTAEIVARRRKGAIAIICIDVEKMVADNTKFYMSSNRVWFVDHVEPKYINCIEVENFDKSDDGQHRRTIYPLE